MFESSLKRWGYSSISRVLVQYSEILGFDPKHEGKQAHICNLRAE